MRGAAIFLFCFLPTILWSQRHAIKQDRYKHFLNEFRKTDNSLVAEENLEKYIVKLETRRSVYKSEVDFLQYLFTKTHNRFLKEYRDHATFGELLDRGKYNCLTGTALYALLLEHLSYDYAIVETNYHIFLLVDADGQKILLETTDPIYGFVTSEREITDRIADYRNNFTASSNGQTYYQFNRDVFNSINLDQLTGLLYYNMSVDAYNKKNLLEAIALLDKAIICYKSPRIEEFSSVILITLMESDLEPEAKKAYIKKVQALIL